MSDRHYQFALTRNRGFRKAQRSTAPRVLQIKESLCENLSSEVEPFGSMPVVSPAISLAVSPASSREQSTIETQGSQSSNQSGSHSGKKPDCYTCAHRRNLVGDAHSSCAALGAIGLFVSKYFIIGESEFLAGDIHIRGNTHGVRSGWFIWPINYDPVWLEICSMHKERAK